MDIDACLTEMRAIYSDWSHLHENYERLAELIEAADNWIRKGGALPLAWKQAQSPLTAHLES